MNFSKSTTSRKVLVAFSMAGLLLGAAPAFSDLASEKDALLKIFDETGGPNWTKAKRWNTSESICTWAGVTCSGSGDTVIGLNLGHRNLTGELPDVFQALPNLTNLAVRENHLRGAVPASLADLQSLNTLELQSNAFVGDISAVANAVTGRGGLVDPEYNGLYSKDGSVAISGFPATQTLDAKIVEVGQIDKSSAVVTWEPVAFTQTGGYQIEFRPAEGDAVVTTVNGKSKNQASVGGLEPGTEYSVVVRSFTEPHGNNENRVLSDGKLFEPKVVTTEDLDTDKDGIGDVAEGKREQPQRDTDGDGIPDFQDPDDDGDGLATRDELEEDTDGDGVVNYLDDDDDGDGIPTADELPVTKDTDNDGLPDYLDPEDNRVLGVESGLPAVVTSKGGGSAGFLLLLLAGLGVLRKKSLPLASWMAAAVLLVAGTTSQVLSADESAGEQLKATTDNALNRSGPLYLGGSAGFTRVEPITRNAPVSVKDKDDFGGKLFVGYSFTDYLALEGFFGNLGQAGLSPQGEVDYKNSGIGLVLTPTGKTAGFTPLLKLGVNRIDNKARNVNYMRDEDYLGFATLGAEYGFNSKFAVRVEYDYYAEDAQMLSLGILRRVGGTPPPLVIREPAPAPQPVVIKTEAPAAPAPQPAPIIQQKMEIPDSDGDGISDFGDKCPNSPPGAEIDEMGCAIFQGNLEGVNFETNSSKLTPEARARLDRVAEALKKFPKLKIEVQAHTDNVGSDRYNQWLSERRARSVIRYLSSQGVSTSRMIPVGYGERSPIASNKTEAGRAQNRRVVFVVR